MAMTAQKFRGAVGSLNSENVALNHVFVWKIREWAVDRSQNMGPKL